MIPESLEATIVLLRHGESVFITEQRFQGQADSPLSPLGRRQADRAGVRLAQPHRSPPLPIPDHAPLEIAHSPLLRTAETAEAVQRAHRVAGGITGDPPALRADAGLAEIGQGVWEGMPRQEVAARYGDVLAAWRKDPTHHHAPGGEPLVDVQARVRVALGSVLANLERAAATARTEGPAPSHVAGYPGPGRPDAPWSLVVGHDGAFKVLLLTLFDLPLARFWSFPFAVCGITVVEIRAGQPVLRIHNSTEHMAPLLDEQAQAETEERQRLGAL